MKIHWILLLAFSLVGHSGVIAQDPAAQPSADQPPYFTLSIKAPQNVIKLDQKPIVIVTMKNISSRNLVPDFNFGFTLQDSTGKSAPRVKHTEPGFASYGNFAYRILKPGQSISGPLDLSKEFAFTKPGKYTVQVWREYYEPHGNKVLGRVKSNTITIDIVE